MLINADLKALEWYCAVFLSQDPVGIQEILDNVDQHADNLVRLGFPDRGVAKVFLFRLVYGGGAWSYAHDPEFMLTSKSEKFWQHAIDQFYEKYDGLHRWHIGLMQEVTTTGRLVMPTGRIYTYEKDKHGNWPRTTILNYPVQGLGADLMMIGRISFFRRFKASNLTGKLVSTIHDSLVVDAPCETLDKLDENCYNICMMLKSCIEDIPMNFERLFGVKFNLPMRCEISYGLNKKDREVLNGST